MLPTHKDVTLFTNSKKGAKEREASYAPIIEVLLREFQDVEESRRLQKLSTLSFLVAHFFVEGISRC
jgi:hypothetical protein